MSTKNRSTNENLIFGGIWLLFMALTLIAFVSFQSYDSIDYDSSYQFFLVQHSWKDMYRLILEDYSPPLYAVLLKVYSSLLGTSLNTLRASNLILGGYLYYLTLFPLRRLTGAKCSALSSVLILCSQYNCYFGHIIRPTYLGYALTTAVFVYAALSFFDRRTKDVITLAVVALLSMYSHNVSLIAAFCVYGILCIFTFIKKDMAMLKKYLISGIAIAALYIPWLLVTMKQVDKANSGFWNLRMKIGETMDFVYSVPFFHRSNVIINLLITLFILMSCIIGPVLLIDRKKLKKATTFKDLGNIFTDSEAKDRLKKIAFIGLMQIISLIAFYAFSYKLNIQSPRYFYVLTAGGLIFIAGLMSLGDRKHIVTVIALIVLPFNMVTNYLFFDRTYNDSEINRLYADIGAAGKESERLYLYHGYETSLGIDSYMFPKAVHLVDKETYTVLPTFDVFTTDVRYIDDGSDPFDMCDEIFIVTYNPFFFPMDPSEYNCEELGVYKIPYAGTETGNIDIYAYRVTPA